MFLSLELELVLHRILPLIAIKGKSKGIVIIDVNRIQQRILLHK